MNPIPLGTGWFPDVAIVDDLVYVAYGANPGPLVLVVLTREGVEVRRQTVPGGFLNSFPRFGGRWLAYKRNLDWRPAAVDVLSGQSFIFHGQADGNFGLTVNDALGVVAYQWTNAYQVWLGSLVDGGSHSTPMTGAPDGLSTLPAADQVILRKDIRLSVPGILWPVRRGDLTVGERPDSGIGVQLDGDALRVALPGQDTPTPSCATDGTTYAIVTGGAQGIRLWLGTRADVQALHAALGLPSERLEMPTIGRPLWLGWFMFGAPVYDLPANCILPVDEHMQVLDAYGRAVIQYVAGSPDGDMDAVDRAIVEARALDRALPVLAYWTRGGQAVRLPTGADIVGVEAYRLKDEPLDTFEARVRSSVARCPLAWLIAQGYTSNSAQHTDLAALVPVYARIARDCPNVEGILVFSAGTRATGWSDHPEVHDAWRALADGIPGTPAVPSPSLPVPAPPVPPAPHPVPPDHPGPPRPVPPKEPMPKNKDEVRADVNELIRFYNEPDGLNRAARGIPTPIVFNDPAITDWFTLAVMQPVEDIKRQIRTFPEYKNQHPNEHPQ